MAYIDIDEFKSLMGIGNLYPDEQLQQVIDAAENLVDGILTYNRSFVQTLDCDGTSAKAFCNTPHSFNVGDSLTITGLNATFNGTQTVTEIGRWWFKFANTHTAADIVFKPAGQALLALQIGMYDDEAPVREAALAIAMDIWGARSAPSGMIQAVDFQPTPYKLGRALLNRVHGLLAPYIDAASFVG